jgi:ornithine--oxo-acid transaminase
MTICSRAFNNEWSGEYAQFITNLFGFDKVLPMNSGVEAVETAVKIARRWGYTVKGVERDQAKVIFPNGCFWGRSITASGACDDPKRYNNFGPFTPGFDLVEYNNLPALEKYFKEDPNIVAYILEPI